MESNTNRTTGDINSYIQTLTHKRLITLNLLTALFISILFISDIIMHPGALLLKFVLYRGGVTSFALLQFVLLKSTLPSRNSFFYAYSLNLLVSLVTSLMTAALGGFNSSYYAGLILIIIGVNLMLPWHHLHTVINSLLTIFIYLVVNLIDGKSFRYELLINNLFFLIIAILLATGISYFKHIIIKQEFFLRQEIKVAKDALWGEMQLAKQIQTALLPINKVIKGYEIAATMVPAEDVGGDYYDILTTNWGERWVAIGDVSGHGVDSGLIMMMAQTSIYSVLNDSRGLKPSKVIHEANLIIKENISRLNTNKYMTISLINMRDNYFVFAGKHQDIMIFRFNEDMVERIPSHGTWIGVTNDMEKYLTDVKVHLNKDDLILLFTDGVTEAENSEGEMFGVERLMDVFKENALLPVAEVMERIIVALQNWQAKQEDDLTLMVIRKV